ncbi:MAG: 3-oxoacyl-ACP reductase family protein [Acidobacteriota bacterium]|nr:3-oxoacyl-ACP reductase FabG [Blastocatellia bacterium]MDW8240231.1 3-oxoacyl-ACP reductase family protein [Acidobacteriota bacterium]
MISLKHQTAVITGGSRGIGAATALMFAQAGANVVVNYFQRKEAALTIVEQARRYGVGAIAVKADVSKLTQARRLFKVAVEKFGRVDILVANAGIWHGAPIDQLDESLWDRVIAINLKGVYTCCHVAAPLMKQQHRGKIILVSSTAGQRGEANYSCYAAAKGAVISFTKSICVELAPFGINVNCVAPGWVDTEMAAPALRDQRQRRQIESQIPLGRVAAPEDVAGAILFLASDLARHITGEVLNVNGGSVLCG